MCHETLLNPTQKQLGINTLKAFLSAENRQQLVGFARSSVHDVECYFPDYKIGCAHCQSSNLDRDFAEIAKSLLTEQATYGERLRVLGQVGQLRRANSAIGWAFVMQCLALQLPLEELQLLGNFFFQGAVPAGAARAFGIPRFEACARLLDATRGWESIDIEIGNKGMARISEVRQLVSKCVEVPLVQLCTSGDEIPSKYLGLVTERFIVEGSDFEVETWFDFLETSNQLRSRDYTELLENWGKSRRELTSQLRSSILMDFSSGMRREYYLDAILKYSSRTANESLSIEAVRAMVEDSQDASSAEIQHVYEFYLRTNWYKPLNLLESSSTLLAKVDFQTIDWLWERSALKPSLRISTKKIFTALKGSSVAVDFFAVLKAHASSPKAISRIDKEKLLQTQNELVTLKGLGYAPRQLEGIRALLLTVLLDHPALLDVSRQAFEHALTRNEIEAIGGLAREIHSSKSRGTSLLDYISTLRPKMERYSLLPIRYFLRENHDQIRVPVFAEYLLELIRNQMQIPSAIFEAFLLSLFRAWSLENMNEFVTALVNLPGGLRIQELNSIAFTLLREENSNPQGLALVEILESNKIPVADFLKHQVFKLRQDSGELFENGVVEGPQAQYWNQLAIIFDDVVHEINQPLYALGLNIQALSRMAPALGEKATSIVEALRQSQSELATRMIHYQALTSEGTQNTWLDLESTIRGVIQDLEDQAIRARVEISFDKSRLGESAFVAGPSFQFKTAIRNLIRNAIAAFDANSKSRQVRVSVFRLKGLPDQVLVSVEDTGIGIPESEQEKIFDRGYTTKKGRGLGLGLTLSASVISGMGGTLKLDKTSSAGSTFLMVLPAKTTAPGGNDFEFDLSNDEFDYDSFDYEEESEDEGN